LRARCAQRAERYDALVESLWTYGNGLYSNARRQSPERRLAVSRNLETLIVALEKNIPATAAATFDIRRRDEVVKKLRDRMRRLE
jgi:hypothetical protein